MKCIVAFLLVATASCAQVGSHRALRIPTGSASLARDRNIFDDVKHDVLHAFNGSKPEVYKSPFDCGSTMFVTSKDAKDAKCPQACPFFVQSTKDDKHCSFQCVTADECASLNPETPIADDLGAQRICRAPMVQFCEEYRYDGTDTCVKCSNSYYLWRDGHCYYKYMLVLYVVAALLGLLAIFVLYWIVDLQQRPHLNMFNLQDALAFRSRRKIHTHKSEENDHRTLFPLTTNLLRTQVAGPGLMLHFNFQFMVIVWGGLVAAGWLLLGLLVDGNLFVLGRLAFGTPRENCILVAWGYEAQHELMWTKILFLACVYLGTFAVTLAHSARQLRIFQIADMETKSMKDFVCLVEGLPNIPGTRHLEVELKKHVAEVTGKEVIGVSVAWEYGEHKDWVDGLMFREIDSSDTQQPGAERAQSREDIAFVRRQLYSLESYIFSEDGFDESLAEPAKVKDMLESLVTSDSCFVVFRTEKERDEVSEKYGEGMPFMDSTLTFKSIVNEPDTIYWENFGHSGPQQLWRLLKGFGAILGALLLWTLVFYAPYAYSIFGFNYDNGQQPGIVYGLAFTIVVIVGNAIMYQVCAEVADNVGLRFKDSREAAYMILYLMACLLNVALDFVTTYFMALQISSELGFHTYGGVKLKDIRSFTHQFESYAVQRVMAENAFSYAFPSTFLIPFLLEPVVTIVAPLMLAEWVVRSHPEIMGHCAHMLLCNSPMELGRYADILLNVLLGILFLYFPGGNTHILFIGLCVSHVWIYCFDHYKVLRVIPNCQFSSMDVDWWCQAMCAPVTGLLLSVLAFKANCQGYGYCLHGLPLVLACGAAFVVHATVHMLLLIYVVPLLGKIRPEDHMSEVTYAHVARSLACSWFNANPINCLRSQFFYEHKPYCRYCFAGKEHLLDENHEIGCFFKDEAAEAEDFGLERLQSAAGSVRKMQRVTRVLSPTKQSAQSA